MALARVVTFDGVDSGRMEELKREIGEEDPPENLPAKEILVLHDAGAEKAVVVIFFDSEEDYRVGDATLDAMPAGETPGSRTSVTKYDVALRRTI
jgi:hypothetical protein